MALWLRFLSTKIILFCLVAAQGVAFRKVDLFYCWKSQVFIPTAHVRTHKPCDDFIFHVYCCVFLNWVLIIKDKKKSDLTSGSLAAVFWKCESESYNTTCFSQLDASIKLCWNLKFWYVSLTFCPWRSRGLYVQSCFVHVPPCAEKANGSPKKWAQAERNIMILKTPLTTYFHTDSHHLSPLG